MLHAPALSFAVRRFKCDAGPGHPARNFRNSSFRHGVVNSTVKRAGNEYRSPRCRFLLSCYRNSLVARDRYGSRSFARPSRSRRVYSGLDSRDNGTRSRRKYRFLFTFAFRRASTFLRLLQSAWESPDPSRYARDRLAGTGERWTISRCLP